jgi:hypothetical protein
MMSSTMISSAVVIPDQPPVEETPNSPSLKRRQSSLSLDNADAKRPRIDSADSRSPPLPPNSGSPPRRKPSLQTKTEERKRNQRLFNGLLSTLSQSTAKPSSKKRDEIEKRQIERIRRDQEEREEERRARKRELEVQREGELKRWEEESRKVKWRNMRAMSGFLRTETEPRLYWRPWEMREEDKERVRRQREEVEEEIRKEEELSKGSNDKEEVGVKMESDDRPQDSEATANGKADASEIKKEPPLDDQDDRNGDNDAVEGVSNEKAASEIKDEQKSPTEEKPKEDEHGGEELVKGQEDDLIY